MIYEVKTKYFLLRYHVLPSTSYDITCEVRSSILADTDDTRLGTWLSVPQYFGRDNCYSSRRALHHGHSKANVAPVREFYVKLSRIQQFSNTPTAVPTYNPMYCEGSILTGMLSVVLVRILKKKQEKVFRFVFVC